MERIKSMFDVIETAQKEIDKIINDTKKTEFYYIENSVKKIEKYFNDLVDSMKGFYSFPLNIGNKEYTINICNLEKKKFVYLSNEINKLIILNSNGYGVVKSNITQELLFDEAKKSCGLIHIGYFKGEEKTFYNPDFISGIVENWTTITESLEDSFQKEIEKSLDFQLRKARQEQKRIDNFKKFLEE